MKKKLRGFINSILKIFNIGIVSYSSIELFKEQNKDINSINKLLSSNYKSKVFDLIAKSPSQLYQDLFVLIESNFKIRGFFVEFGATNGIDLSNTYLLEKNFQWDGILAEPAICWHKELKLNRNCKIETNCVWQESNKVLTFNQVDLAELSTINTFNNCDNNSKLRAHGQNYSVNTISLFDLLEKYNAPKTIDYLSIDTEGSEYDILKNFDFTKYKFNIISCEHNYTSTRKKIFKILTNNGYVRKYSSFSKWDDWYVRIENNI